MSEHPIDLIVATLRHNEEYYLSPEKQAADILHAIDAAGLAIGPKEPPRTEQKTIDMEVAVAVRSDGVWTAQGNCHGNPSRRYMESKVMNDLSPDKECHHVIVKATVPIPERIAATIQGTAEVVEGDIGE